MDAIDQLISFNRTTGLLQSVAGRNAWDQETMMPSMSGNSQAMEMSALEEVIHIEKKNSKVRSYWKKPNLKQLFKELALMKKTLTER